jgi:diguanylate cyclase (GGDEF)-like protein
VGLASVVLLFRRSSEMRTEISAREQAEARALDLARHDPLTGLPNRRRFNEELATALSQSAGVGHECAVFLIDLDQFKSINDLHGHATGDGLLIEIAERLKGIDTAARFARLGGDEFVGLLSYPSGGDAPIRMAGQIMRALAEPFYIAGVKIDAGATLGVSRSPIDATDSAELIRLADIAMYEGKRSGRGTYRIFHAEMDARLRERAVLESELRSAIQNGEIKAYFQPIISLEDEQILGFEALARWEHPKRGTICPDIFIPIAEDIGVIDILSYGILRDACIAARDWPRHATLSVNISPLQLKDPWLSSRLLNILVETGFAPGRLIVEVTENAIIDDMALAAEVFTSLQNAGVRIALDDFGKGYSSLYHLRQLKFDHLKIDSSFVMSMDSSESEKIVRAITGLGQSLGMPVTAEGVETRNSAALLRGFGCEQAQGYLFGKPINAIETKGLFQDSVKPAKPARQARSA